MDKKISDIEDNNKKKKHIDIKLKSEMYNHDNELIERREIDEETNDAVMWGFVLGFILFIIILVCIIFFTSR